MAICGEPDLQLAIVEDMAGPRATQLFKLSLAALVAFLLVTVALLTHTTRIERSWNSRKLASGNLHMFAEIQIDQKCKYSVSMAERAKRVVPVFMFCFLWLE